MMKKYKILALIGRSGVGKDTLKKYLLQSFPNQVSSIISYTTRPPRQGEKNGVDYFFISTDEFSDKIINGSMIEASRFNNWFYGTGIENLSLDKINVGIFSPASIECLIDSSNIDIKIIELKLSHEKDYLIRCLSREENPDCSEICRRYQADLKDFSFLDFPTEIYYNDKKPPMKPFWKNLIMKSWQDKSE